MRCEWPDHEEQMPPTGFRKLLTRTSPEGMHNHSPGLSPALGDETLGNRRNTSTGTLKGCDKTAVLLRIIAWPLTSQSLKSFDLGNTPSRPGPQKTITAEDAEQVNN